MLKNHHQNFWLFLTRNINYLSNLGRDLKTLWTTDLADRLATLILESGF